MSTNPNNAGNIKFITHNITVAAKATERCRPMIFHTKIAISVLAKKLKNGGKGIVDWIKNIAEMPPINSNIEFSTFKKYNINKYCVR